MTIACCFLHYQLLRSSKQIIMALCLNSLTLLKQVVHCISYYMQSGWTSFHNLLSIFSFHFYYASFVNVSWTDELLLGESWLSPRRENEALGHPIINRFSKIAHTCASYMDKQSKRLFPCCIARKDIRCDDKNLQRNKQKRGEVQKDSRVIPHTALHVQFCLMGVSYVYISHFVFSFPMQCWETVFSFSFPCCNDMVCQEMTVQTLNV